MSLHYFFVHFVVVMTIVMIIPASPQSTFGGLCYVGPNVFGHKCLHGHKDAVLVLHRQRVCAVGA